MSKRVLDVGNCAPDHGTLTRFLEMNFPGVVVIRAQEAAEALDALQTQKFDLVLINRKLDYDYSDGIDIVKTMQANDRFREVPVMLLTNYPEYQAQAVAAGARPGFGKLEYHLPATLEKLAPFLQE